MIRKWRMEWQTSKGVTPNLCRNNLLKPQTTKKEYKFGSLDNNDVVLVRLFCISNLFSTT